MINEVTKRLLRRSGDANFCCELSLYVRFLKGSASKLRG
jgi:hypothetical protein